MLQVLALLLPLLLAGQADDPITPRAFKHVICAVLLLATGTDCCAGCLLREFGGVCGALLDAAARRVRDWTSGHAWGLG